MKTMSNPLFGEHVVGHLSEVAEHFEVTLRTAQRWAKNGMPRLGRKHFDLRAIENWLAAEKSGVAKDLPGIEYFLRLQGYEAESVLISGILIAKGLEVCGHSEKLEVLKIVKELLVVFERISD